MKKGYKRILDDMEKEAIVAIGKMVLQMIKEEKEEEIKEEIKLLEEAEETIKRLDKKISEFLKNNELSNTDNLNKFLNVLEEPEKFLDEILNK